MLFPRSLLIAAALLGGCATPPSKSPDELTQPAQPKAAASPLAGIIPADAAEADLIAHPEDLRGLAAHATLLHHRAAVASSPDEARALRRKARTFALAAIQGGSQDLLLPLMVRSIREDGSEVETVHSEHAGADKLVAEGEKKFARGDLDGALADYIAARKLDPRSARITLFIGDVYFVKKDNVSAVAWFDRAIELAPFSETAHRYRADALMRLRRVDEAGEGYISAVVADPYNRLPVGMLQHWAQQNRKPFQRPNVAFPTGNIAAKDSKFELQLNPDPGTLSLLYLLSRVAYCEEQHIKPADYRHSLAEETHALKAVVAVAEEMQVRGDPESAEELKSHDEALKYIQRMIDNKLLEAHVLLDRPDEGIAQDYAAYRAAHGAQIRKYVRAIWLSEK